MGIKAISITSLTFDNRRRLFFKKKEEAETYFAASLLWCLSLPEFCRNLSMWEGRWTVYI